MPTVFLVAIGISTFLYVLSNPGTFHVLQHSLRWLYGRIVVGSAAVSRIAVGGLVLALVIIGLYCLGSTFLLGLAVAATYVGNNTVVTVVCFLHAMLAISMFYPANAFSEKEISVPSLKLKLGSKIDVVTPKLSLKKKQNYGSAVIVDVALVYMNLCAVSYLYPSMYFSWWYLPGMLMLVWVGIAWNMVGRIFRKEGPIAPYVLSATLTVIFVFFVFSIPFTTQVEAFVTRTETSNRSENANTIAQKLQNRPVNKVVVEKAYRFRLVHGAFGKTEVVPVTDSAGNRLYFVKDTEFKTPDAVVKSEGEIDQFIPVFRAEPLSGKYLTPPYNHDQWEYLAVEDTNVLEKAKTNGSSATSSSSSSSNAKAGYSDQYITVNSDGSWTVTVPSWLKEGVPLRLSDGREFQINPKDHEDIVATGLVDIGRGQVGPNGEAGYFDATIDGPYPDHVGGLEMWIGPNKGANRFLVGSHLSQDFNYSGVPTLRVIESLYGYGDGNKDAFTVTIRKISP